MDAALALAVETGERWTDALSHRIRGDIVLKVAIPTTARSAEEAFLAAVAVAQRAGVRGASALRAALSLAQLYQSTGRPADAHAVLAPALEGFAPTPELPEIDGGQALLAALAETDAWKSAAGSRERRLKLQAGYGHAVAMSRGFASEEAKAAFARVRELATGSR